MDLQPDRRAFGDLGRDRESLPNLVDPGVQGSRLETAAAHAAGAGREPDPAAPEIGLHMQGTAAVHRQRRGRTAKARERAQVQTGGEVEGADRAVPGVGHEEPVADRRQGAREDSLQRVDSAQGLAVRVEAQHQVRTPVRDEQDIPLAHPRKAGAPSLPANAAA